MINTIFEKKNLAQPVTINHNKFFDSERRTKYLRVSIHEVHCMRMVDMKYTYEDTSYVHANHKIVFAFYSIFLHNFKFCDCNKK